MGAWDWGQLDQSPPGRPAEGTPGECLLFLPLDWGLSSHPPRCPAARRGPLERLTSWTPPCPPSRGLSPLPPQGKRGFREGRPPARGHTESEQKAGTGTQVGKTPWSLRLHPPTGQLWRSRPPGSPLQAAGGAVTHPSPCLSQGPGGGPAPPPGRHSLLSDTSYQCWEVWPSSRDKGAPIPTRCHPSEEPAASPTRPPGFERTRSALPAPNPPAPPPPAPQSHYRPGLSNDSN